jgi:LacI family transcriptional regulator, gluconate utilization system Gnt-I transcriptional repressor
MSLAKPRAPEAVRMRDVAQRLGMSAMTVSRALSNPESVSKDTLARVRKAVDKLGYLPNRVAGSLSSRRSDIVGLIIPGISNSLYASTAQAVSEVLRNRGFHLMIARSGHDPLEEEAAISAFLSQQVCGLILHGTNHTPRAASLIKSAAVPTVEIGRLTPHPLDMCVSYSGYAAVKAMVGHLGQCGYRRIGFVSLPTQNNERSVERRRGFFAGLRALGLAVDKEAAIEADPGFAGGATALSRLTARDPSLEAIFFAADVMAVGALFECQRRGWAVPDRLAIASFDDVDLLSHVVPTITTLRIPREEIGRRSASALLDRLDGRTAKSLVEDLGFSIVQRASTKAVERP